MQTEVLEHLRRDPPHLPSKYFYDADGAALFEAICELPEYYPTRTEIGILQASLPAIAADLGPDRWVVEPGSGSGIKTRMLLDALHAPRGYVPIDISKSQLLDYGWELAGHYPQLQIRPICADFTQDLQLPDDLQAPVIWFPGSTIGNFPPEQARDFLRRLKRWGGGRAELLIGVDLHKDTATLEAAYNDSQGVTAAFNRNLLHHLNRRLGCEIDPDSFQHSARYNAEIGAIQMFLVSARDQALQIDGQRISLAAGQAICTEYSYKYRIEGFRDLAAEAGWQLHHNYCDDKGWFSVFHLR